MRVLDHQPQRWYLFDDDGALFLDANWSLSAVGYSFMIQLNPDEVREYETRGRAYLDSLALDTPLHGAPSARAPAPSTRAATSRRCMRHR